MNRQASASTRPVAEVATEFLAKQRIAVTGVSHAPKGHGSNTVYTRLRDRGYQVFAVNPNADTAEGDPTYPNLAAIPDGVEAVVVATRPEHAMDTIRECIDLGIDLVWMHRSFGAGSVSAAAAAFGREHGITVIDGGCPLMFEPASDPGHKFIKLVTKLTRRLPAEV
ncbi:MAG: CoA-binding protein [Actinomycetota bacterium]